jgi:hypothetical protein
MEEFDGVVEIFAVTEDGKVTVVQPEERIEAGKVFERDAVEVYIAGIGLRAPGKIFRIESGKNGKELLVIFQRKKGTVGRERIKMFFREDLEVAALGADADGEILQGGFIIRDHGDVGFQNIGHFIGADLLHIHIEIQVEGGTADNDFEFLIIRNAGLGNHIEKIDAEGAGDEHKEVFPPAVCEMIFQLIGIQD